MPRARDPGSRGAARAVKLGRVASSIGLLQKRGGTYFGTYFERLREKLRTMLPELLEANRVIPTQEDMEGVSFELPVTSHRQERVRLAS